MPVRRTTYVAPDGARWDVDVQVPGASNAMIVFRVPGERRDRYAWHAWHGPEARNVTGRLTAQKVMDSLDELTLARLFRRSMPVQAGRTPLG
ncbi:MAG TPA: hypothetical protein VNW46_12610 [Gemmatimonadaceae bacterium]|jgi:hypothetical protein|nr:hypothetical protein [Gemmatimonadaceae bacterium]